MKNLMIIIFLYLMICVKPAGGEMMASNQGGRIVPPGPNDVVIAPNAVRIPLGRILLVRKDSEYCAVKLTKFWTGKTEQDRYAEYESYYQGDNTGDFSNKNMIFRKGKLSFPKPRGIGRFAFSFGNRDVRCGPIKLAWYGENWVYFFSTNQKQGDYGIELAPTTWTDISRVNVFDPRVKWYRYDSKREDITIPIDKLWENE